MLGNQVIEWVRETRGSDTHRCLLLGEGAHVNPKKKDSLSREKAETQGGLSPPGFRTGRASEKSLKLPAGRKGDQPDADIWVRLSCFSRFPLTSW